jgi:hypothetical protein
MAHVLPTTSAPVPHEFPDIVVEMCDSRDVPVNVP